MDCMQIRKARLRKGRVENAEFAVKDLPLWRTLWLIDALSFSTDSMKAQNLDLHAFAKSLDYIIQVLRGSVVRRRTD